jgi:hypothetical protein
VKSKTPNPHRESNPISPIVQPVAQRYTDWGITALAYIYRWYWNGFWKNTVRRCGVDSTSLGKSTIADFCLLVDVPSVSIKTKYLHRLSKYQIFKSLLFDKFLWINSEPIIGLSRSSLTSYFLGDIEISQEKQVRTKYSPFPCKIWVGSGTPQDVWRVLCEETIINTCVHSRHDESIEWWVMDRMSSQPYIRCI